MDDNDFGPGHLDMDPFEAMLGNHHCGRDQWAIVWITTGVVQVCDSEADARTAAATLKGVLVQSRYITAWVQETRPNAA